MRAVGVAVLLLTACGGRVTAGTAAAADATTEPGTIGDAAGSFDVATPEVARDTRVDEATPEVGAGAPDAAPTACDAGGAMVTACTNGIDDDGDGRIDWLDPECLSPLDNDEAAFPLGTFHEFYDPCKSDCVFDGNIGSGDDGCTFYGRCLVGSTDPRCPYDPEWALDPTRCPSPSEKCIDSCRPRTPKGCDCGGCCDVFDASGASRRRRVFAPGCSLAKLDDPVACPPCEKIAACERPCLRCDYCLGKTALPADCASEPSSCAVGEQRCDPKTPCPCGEFCLSGCCVKT